ncbi:uncharacterized protein LOC112555383 [Pomacea canaliculata]|uniref:uncharacterized protein LOC112555383 n=1 Tax=Pomacea canaliculata TaxID=400727 RepID=UPI000D72DA43|nr:uncharacterized protein LOC112555383 [Pomacea canaliculata]
MSGLTQKAVDLPELVNLSVEETSGKGTCTLRYFYPAQESDSIDWSIKDNSMIFKVFRAGSDRVAYLKQSKLIPEDLQKQLEVQKRKLKYNAKIPHYKVVLKKKADFTLDVYFQPDSPPV